jgi:hypothetical protein
VVALALSPLSEAAQAEYAWHKGDGSIYFGEKDSHEDIGLLFHCEEAGKVSLFVARTESKLKPDKKISLSITAQPAQSRLNAETVPNEMDGDVSINATLAADDPIFEGMRSAKSLSLNAAGWSASYKLAGAAKLISGFQAACKKPR